MRIAESVTFGGAGAGVIDRAADRRVRPEEEARLAADPRARVLPLWRGQPLMVESPEARLGWRPMGDPLSRGSAPPILLGVAGGAPESPADPGGPCFAVDLSDVPGTAAASDAPPEVPPGHAFADLRAAAPGLSPVEAELAAAARALTGWHAAHGFCARCGARSEPAQAGWQRDCPACGAHHFPRTDPVVIVLVTHGEAALLGRSPGWPEGMFSLLAGFVEPGETIEAAVRREVFEEAGVRVAEVGYLASQPWPFPASLMIGCCGRALGRELTLDATEIEDALWLTREEMALAFAGRHARVRPPREGAIAGFLLRAWLADRLG